jgi:hypothetical protein
MSNSHQGRPVAQINYPQGEFSIADLATVNPEVSKVTLQLRVHKDLNQKVVSLVGSRKSKGKGRPANVFSLIPKT